MSTTAELAKVLTEENRAEVLPRYFGLSAREAQEVTAELAPRQSPPARDLVTRVGMDRALQLAVRPVVVPVPVAMPTPVAVADLTGKSVQTFGLLPSDPGQSAAPPTRDDVEPLSADLRRLHITVGREFLRELEKARDGLSHAIPNATTEQVLQAALRLLLEKQARARGVVRRPRAVAPPSPSTRTRTPTATPTATTIPTEPPPHRRPGARQAIPAAIRRAVWSRDGGRCSWPLDDGGTCGSTHRLELDHLVPWARGGEDAVDNLRLTCSHHNRLAALRAFGERQLDRYRAGSGRRGSA
jgi:hypothetical protein